MKRLALLTILGAIAQTITPGVTLAQTPLPRANANGDYLQRTSHPTWVVVDPDPNGLNCRWSRQMPVEWYSPSAQLPRMDVVNWPVVRQFRSGTLLRANTTPAGFATMADTRGLPWLKVSIGPNDQICLVRANRRFIRPVQ
ncbi:MAG TPA: hypothetical protein IGS37_11000 [Synechococcales cyanobacterium M55_K2018_004]|nr:hypothetical protein [Synechococcales cyanobacterium M55_K2018_004]